jgi:glutaredoxin 3
MEEVKVYTTSYCGYCHAAKAFLRSLGVAFTEIDVTSDQGMRVKLVEWTRQRTVPQIFIGGRAIGGYTDMKALHAEGALMPLLHGEADA